MFPDHLSHKNLIHKSCTMPKPIPKPDAATKEYWNAVNNRRLIAQYCDDCKRYQHPPELLCHRCGGNNVQFVPLSGRGTIYSWQVMHDTRVKLMQEYQPFIIAIIESDESPDVLHLTNLPGSSIGEFKIGDSVEVEFEEIRPGKFIPQFRTSN